MLLTGCGSSASSPTSAQSRKYQKALAFVQCMRAHGEPAFPDPNGQGIISDSQANLNSPVLLAGRATRKSQFPFGPFLIAGTLGVMLASGFVSALAS